jgi:hypothetical protein
MVGQHPQQVAPLPGTQADHAQRTGRASVQYGPDLRLNNLQPPRQE